MANIYYILRKIGILVFVIALTNTSYANMDVMHHSNKHALGFTSWTMYLNDNPGHKNYKAPNDIIKNGCHWGTWITFDQKIEAIQATVGKFTSPIELLRSKDFLIMHKHHGYYYEAIFDYLVDQRYTLEKKKIAVFALSHSYQLCEDAYNLYKSNKISLDLLRLIFSINITNLIARHHVGKSYENVVYTLKKVGIYTFLKQVRKELVSKTALHNELTEILNNIFPKKWHAHLITSDECCYNYYCDSDIKLPFCDIITYAAKEKRNWDHYHFGAPMPINMLSVPWFLVILEHPGPYYPYQFGTYTGLKDGISVLRDPEYSHEEKSMAIFGMSQLNAKNYAFLIESACIFYRQGQLSVEHLYQLFYCNFPTFYKYPFFILDYKDEEVQRALGVFLSVPTIPDSLKEIARKVKNGTLATKKEMNYMHSYLEFRKTYFTLYETIPASWTSGSE